MHFRVRHFIPPVVLILLSACSSLLDGNPHDGDAASGSGGAGGATDHADDLLIDDFEDKDDRTALGTVWYPYSDSDSGGGSEIGPGPGAAALFTADGYQSSGKLSVAYTFAQEDYAYDPFVGVGAPIPTSAPVGDFEGLTYMYRGSAHTVRFETSDVLDYDYFTFSLPAVTEWSTATIPFEQLRQAGYGVVTTWDPALLQNIAWHATGSDGTSGALELDDIYFDKEVVVDKGPANLGIEDAAPPPLTQLESIEIPGALQAKAFAQLNRGYNITNWLEQARFASFEYDQAFIEDLADAGFLALRLPIDLDLYITARQGSGDALQLTLHDDLWKVLDSFDEWTLATGLSFTIDYHQYDGSLDLNDPESVAEVVALWRAVAEHFASNSRDDLYFELMNEPELSSGSSAILAQGPWTDAATSIIAAIRAEDATHTIIFGDVNWYGIDKLITRSPFADDNIVYAFHSYDPFIFSHQGASWASMATTHDVPYPYSPERWSEYGSDFGINAATPSWIWSQYQNYYVQGTRNALFNRVAQVKAWGVEHGVPVLVNEFGAYERTAQRDDIIRYYTDLIDIYEGLEIPWQIWFMILQEDGTVPADLVDAFHLGK